MKATGCWCAAVVCVMAASAADSGTVRGPVSGYVLDARARSLRPVNGIPGGATLGAPLQLGFRLNLAAVSAEKDFAVVTEFRKAAVPVLVKALSSGSPVIVPLTGAIAATALDLSDGGGAAMVCSATDGKLQLITGLPDNPVVLPAVDVSGWNGGIVAGAVDPSGTQVLAAAGDGNIYLYSVQGQALSDAEWVGRVPGASAMAFAATGTGVVGSATSGDVMVIRGLGGVPTVSQAAGAADGIESVRALRPAGPEGICVVEGPSGKAGIIDVSAPAVHWLSPSGPASRCDRLNASVLALNQAGRDPLLLLDSSGVPGIFFVPAN